MSSTFTPSSLVDMSKERDWPASLGMLDWDNSSIVFTKRSLIEFLKYTGITVDTNFSNIGKLPRYAKIGKLSDPVDVDSANNSTESANTAQEQINRPVRTTHTGIFANIDEGDALSSAPQNSGTEKATDEGIQESQDSSGINFSSSVKPSRRVRTLPGGNSSMANLWDPEESEQQFKPTRRVRQGPGGQDHIQDFF